MFDKETILKVWNNARPYGHLDPAQYRIDECGALMRFRDRGNRNNPSSILNIVFSIC